jgi:hypothetical protein
MQRAGDKFRVAPDIRKMQPEPARLRLGRRGRQPIAEAGTKARERQPDIEHR